jgi:broad specificity phosphatase PhoE
MLRGNCRMQWILVRHGETEWTSSHRYCGISDVPISRAGIAQAANLANEVVLWEPTHIFVSPLRRTQETLERILKNVNCRATVHFEPKLREVDFGEWEGRTVEEIRRLDRNRYEAWCDNPALVAPGGGEAIEDVLLRITSFWNEVEHSISNESTILVVSHRSLLRIWGAVWLGIGLEKYRSRLSFDPAHSSGFCGPSTDPLLLWWNKDPSLCNEKSDQ